MIKFLRGFFIVVFILITWQTVTASLHSNVLEGFRTLWADPWGRATLFDTYLALLTFYCWVFYKEKGFFSRALWFALILGLGNIATSIYMLIKLFQLDASSQWRDLLLRSEDR